MKNEIKTNETLWTGRSWFARNDRDGTKDRMITVTATLDDSLPMTEIMDTLQELAHDKFEAQLKKTATGNINNWDCIDSDETEG